MDDSLNISREFYELLLTQAQLGRNVNNVTHDANNYLGAIMAYAELIELESELLPESERMLKELLEAVERCSCMLGTLATISRKSPVQAVGCDIPDLYKRVVELFTYEFKNSRIDVKKEFDIEECILKIDEAKLQRILMYMMVLLIEVLHGVKHPSLKLSIHDQDQHVILSTGVPGMDLSTHASQGMFEPFYTLPDSNRTIVGLAKARELACSMGAEILVDSKYGLQLVLNRED